MKILWPREVTRMSHCQLQIKEDNVHTNSTKIVTAKDRKCFYPIVLGVGFPILNMKHSIFTMVFLNLRNKRVKNFPSILWERATCCFTQVEVELF